MFNANYINTDYILLRQKLFYENKFLCDFYISLNIDF